MCSLSHRPPVLSKFTAEQLVEALDETWERKQNLSLAAFHICEELLARVIVENVPGAAIIVVTQDTSHDAPHGHLKRVRDAAGNVLVDASSAEYHDLPWAYQADEYVYDLYNEMPGVFAEITDGGETFVGHMFPAAPQQAEGPQTGEVL